MAKKNRQPLLLKDGYPVSNLEELQEHFDLDRVIECLQNGSLGQWLKERYYEIEYERILELNPETKDLDAELYSLFNIDSAEAQIAINRKKDRLEKEEAERKAREEAERKAREEAERKAREEAERKAREEAERKAREEAERKAREEAERKAREEAERKAREEAEKKAREEAERKAREEAERKARKEAERKARKEAERKAREEAERKAREEAERKAREEAERKAREEAQKKNGENLGSVALFCSLAGWLVTPFKRYFVLFAVLGFVLGIYSRTIHKTKRAFVAICLGFIVVIAIPMGIYSDAAENQTKIADNTEITEVIQTKPVPVTIENCQIVVKIP